MHTWNTKTRDAQTRPFSLGTRTRVTGFLQVKFEQRKLRLKKTKDIKKNRLTAVKEAKRGICKLVLVQCENALIHLPLPRHSFTIGHVQDLRVTRKVNVICGFFVILVLRLGMPWNANRV